jgi:hypothetical protein
MSKLDIMKKEYAEVVQKFDELNKKQQKHAKNYNDRFEKGFRFTSKEEADKHVNKQNEMMMELAKLATRQQELSHKILIREEALDLLKELGLYSDAPKEKSRLDKFLSIF